MFHHFHRGHAQGFERRQLGFQIEILAKLFRMELEIDPALYPDALDFADVARPRAERQPVERVDRLVIFIELLLKKLGLPRGVAGRLLGGLGRGNARKYPEACDDRGSEEGFLLRRQSIVPLFIKRLLVPEVYG
jgi:hypothetical protein